MPARERQALGRWDEGSAGEDPPPPFPEPGTTQPGLALAPALGVRGQALETASVNSRAKRGVPAVLETGRGGKKKRTKKIIIN